MLKGFGYLISSVSVVLLGIVAWDSAEGHPALLACLVSGMAASILGMAVRWASYMRDKGR